MTLHIAFVCDAFVLQVGDRLLTTETENSIDEWDPYSNKSIFLVADDGWVAISYAGLAHVAGEATDQWLVGAITGVSPEAILETEGPAMYMGPPLNLTLTGVCAAIENAIDTDFLAEPEDDRHVGIEVLISGWRSEVYESGRRLSTFVRAITHDGLADQPCEVNSPGSGRAFLENGPANWTVLGIGRCTDEQLATITRRLATPGAHVTEKDVERVLIEEIRAVAGPSSGVGTELMSIYVPPPHIDPRIRFVRDVTLERPRDAYCPAFVASSGMVSYHSVLSGPGHFNFVSTDNEEDPRRVRVECIPPFPYAPGPTTLSSQPRPRLED